MPGSTELGQNVDNQNYQNIDLIRSIEGCYAHFSLE
jgi:hypothetical protein